jgi:hypothetical protein
MAWLIAMAVVSVFAVFFSAFEITHELSRIATALEASNQAERERERDIL